MNPKIFVIAAIAVLVGIIGVIFMSTSITDTSDQSVQETKNQVEPVKINLEKISVLEVSDRSAELEIQFKLDNPNSRSVIANVVKYSLYASDNSDEYKITSSEIGSRPQGMVDSSDYYTLLSNGSIVLKDRITLDYPGNSPELMNILKSNEPKWRVQGTVYFNLSSMTSGQENQVNFDLTS